MARGKMDQELLALSRASKHIEDLEDPRAQSRVATYLMMRYTAAGEQNLPSEDRFKIESDARQLMIPGTETAPPIPAATRPATPADATPATVTPSAPTTDAGATATGRGDALPGPGPDIRDIPPPVVTGWGLAGDEGGNDDEGNRPPPIAKPRPGFKKLVDPQKPLKKEKTLKDSASGGWDLVGGDEEVEVEI